MSYSRIFCYLIDRAYQLKALEIQAEGLLSDAAISIGI